MKLQFVLVETQKFIGAETLEENPAEAVCCHDAALWSSRHLASSFSYSHFSGKEFMRINDYVTWRS